MAALQHGSATVKAREAASLWPEDLSTVLANPSLTHAARIAIVYLRLKAGAWGRDVTHLLSRLPADTGIAESTFRGTARKGDGAQDVLLAAGYLVRDRRPGGDEFLWISEDPDPSTRVFRPDPQQEFQFTRDLPDGPGPSADEMPAIALRPPSTAGSQGAAMMDHPAATVRGDDRASSSVGGADSARNPREFRAVFAPPTKDQEARAQLHQHQRTKEPKSPLGLGLEGRAESARNSRGGGPETLGEIAPQAALEMLAPGLALAANRARRDEIVAAVLGRVPGAAEQQACVFADAVMHHHVGIESLDRAVAWARRIEAAGEVRTDFASLVFGALKGECRRQGFEWPKKPR